MSFLCFAIDDSHDVFRLSILPYRSNCFEFATNITETLDSMLILSTFHMTVATQKVNVTVTSQGFLFFLLNTLTQKQTEICFFVEQPTKISRQISLSKDRSVTQPGVI